MDTRRHFRRAFFFWPGKSSVHYVVLLPLFASFLPVRWSWDIGGGIADGLVISLPFTPSCLDATFSSGFLFLPLLASTNLSRRARRHSGAGLVFEDAFDKMRVVAGRQVCTSARRCIRQRCREGMYFSTISTMFISSLSQTFAPFVSLLYFSSTTFSEPASSSPRHQQTRCRPPIPVRTLDVRTKGENAVKKKG